MMKLHIHQSIVLASICCRPAKHIFSRALLPCPSKTSRLAHAKSYDSSLSLQFRKFRRVRQHYSEVTTGEVVRETDLNDDLNYAIDECWAATSWTVNAADDEKTNELVRCFNSPAPQSFFALTRALNKAAAPDQKEKYDEEDVFRAFSIHLKRGFQFGIRRDEEGNMLEWAILPSVVAADAEDGQSDEQKFERLKPFEDFPNTMSIVHHLLDLVTEASEMQDPIEPEVVSSLVAMAIHRLKLTLGTDIRSRASADAAFAFAMAGVTNDEIYNILATISKKELLRVGPRPSFPSKYVLQIIEKLAAAGMRGPEVDQVYEVAADLLESKDDNHDDVIASLRSEGAFGLHSTRPLLWLWRFAARQSKVKLVPQTLAESVAKATPDCSWVDRFDDSSLDLVVDIGCGMGVSLLGLSTQVVDRQVRTSEPIADIDYDNCNFVGCDLSQLLIGYGSGISTRWQATEKLHFVCQPADQFVRDVALYPGKVRLVMIQFPTPFRLPKLAEGNPQLPSQLGFMVSEDLLRSIANVLKQQSEDGLLLIQSNCEDVAVYIRDLAVEKVGMTCVDAQYPVDDLGTSDDLPQRSREWIAMSGKRPMGEPCWSKTALLPRKGQTETEVACALQGTPVHRCLLRV